MKNNQTTRTIILALLLLVSFTSMALVQGLPDPGPPPPPPPPGLPIDGGVFMGIVVAIAYGAKKTLFNKEK
ncbi:PID-CTERM protein-sorting domain-containing protein [Pseudotamlana agarivorans]|uniref:PID-CTERM protein-sorting domain-containing protein n=1 Tax=Pseudotamlana agarivorans TaxID=481183 RepID=UPI000836D121|nr:hypothetical protein [Tamlana agarivorans]